MNNKIKIYELGNIEVIGEVPKPDIDYLISLRVALKKIEKDVSDKENPFYLYKMYYLATEALQEIGTSKKLEVKHGKTDSQNLRWFIESVGRNEGFDPKEYYHNEMLKIINSYAERLD